MNSMTGYGRGEDGRPGLSVTVEIRSVNSRFRDINLRAPREYGALEPRIKALLKGRFARGRLDITVHRVAAAGGADVAVDAALDASYYEALRGLADTLGGGEVPLELVAQQPGVLSSREAPVDADAEWPAVEAALIRAADGLAQMRAVEGEALRADLQAHLEALASLTERAVARSEGLSQRLQARLLERLERLLSEPLEPARLAQEVAVLADRADINEELSRLRSHLDQLGAALSSEGPVGRRLEFLAQEIHREINTIGSKSSEVGTSELVVDMKSTLERIREQVANAE
jgi:uncharacterized protein (TIGR00255 family)